MKETDNKFISTQELGSLLGVTRQTIRNWIKKGDVTAYHIGQNLKIPVQEAVRILAHYNLPIPAWLQDLEANTAGQEHGALQRVSGLPSRRPRPQA